MMADLAGWSSTGYEKRRAKKRAALAAVMRPSLLGNESMMSVLVVLRNWRREVK